MTVKGFEDKSFAAQEVEQSGMPMVTSIVDGGSFEEKSSLEPVDIDPLLLSLLQVCLCFYIHAIGNACFDHRAFKFFG